MIYIEPNAGIAPIEQMIEQAQPGGELMLNFYYLDNRQAIGSIAEAVARGVHVFAIVEGNPYGISQDRVAAEVSALQQAGAKVETTPARFQGSDGHYAFDHAKYMVNHNEVLIATANLDEAAVSHNREYIFTSTDPTLIKAMETLFVADWSGKNADDQVRQMAPSLVLSPGAVDPILSEINQPGKICAEVEELGSDPAIISAFAAKGGDATLIVPTGGSAKERHTLSKLTSEFGVHVFEMPSDQLYLHAKLIVGADGAYLGSQNFSVTSLTYNREVGITLTDASDYFPRAESCQRDAEQSQPVSGNGG